MEDERSASSVIGIVLLVAVAVIIATVVGVLALGLAEETEPAPRHVVDYEPYNEDHGVVHGTFMGGDNIDTERLQERGGAVELGFSGFTATAGNTNFAYVRPGQTLYLVYETDTGETQVVEQYTAPEDATLEHVDWDGSTTTAEDFESQFWDHNNNAGGVNWTDRSDHIRATAFGSDSYALYSRTVPANDGEITVDLHLETRSFDDSSYKILVRDESNDRHVLWCEDNAGFGLNCPAGSSINGSQSKTISVDEEIGSLQVLIALGDGGTDEALLYEMKARD